MIPGIVAGQGTSIVGGYKVEKSLRFRSSASAYLSRTPVVAGNRRTWTWSGWVKRGSLAGEQCLLTNEVTSTVSEYIIFSTSSTIRIGFSPTGGAVTLYRETSAVFRDPSAHYHVLVIVDTASAAAQNRIRLFVNGTEITSWATNVTVPQNLDTFFNNTNRHAIGTVAATNFLGISPLDGYISEINFIDGQALTPDSFGEINPDTGVWVPKAYSGSYGTNGFYLPFNEGSNLTELCRDRSGNTNDWTATNVSLTAGATYDWMDDTPTNNFAVLNPLNSGTVAVITRGNLDSVFPGDSTLGNSIHSAFGVTSGKWYWEATFGQVGTPSFNFGVGVTTDITQVPLQTGQLVYARDGSKLNAGASTAYGASYTTNDIIGIALDLDAGTLEFFKNNVSQGVAFTGLSGQYFPSHRLVREPTYESSFVLNFGQRPFAYTPPTGFLPLCTKNLPAPAIARPDQHFKTYLYTGNGGALQVGEVKKKLEPYTVERSLRFRASASAYLSRTPSGADRKTWTYSTWFKRGDLAVANQELLGYYQGNINSQLDFNFNSNGGIVVVDYSGSYSVQLVTSAAYRDPSAWYHVVLTYDTTNAVAAERVRLYVNGIRVTAFSTATYPAQNYNSQAWQNSPMQIATKGGLGYFDGYLSEINFIDGQALGPEEFGQTDGNGYWVPKAYSGTYGTNGFYLPFNNTTSLATLTADASGNGNDWTATNISLTAGETYDSMVDVPGNTYAVLNPLDAVQHTTSQANLFVTRGTATDPRYIRGSLFVSSGKWYWETFHGTSASLEWTGIGSATATSAGGGVPTAESVLYATNGQRYVNGVNSAYGATWAVNTDLIGVALDLDTHQVTFYKNNVSQGAISIPSGQRWTLFTLLNGNAPATMWANFGQRPFAYTPPEGFLPLSENNLPEELNDMESPGLVWIKNRSVSQDHALFDQVRGVQKYIRSNATTVETNDANSLVQFNRNGFYIGSSAAVNTANNNYVAWGWKAHGVGVTNTDGSITSTVSANTTAGFSIVTYTGTVANATVGHGLGVVPAFIMGKSRGSGTGNWIARHSSFTANQFIWLNAQNGVSNNSAVFTSAPTSSVIHLGSDGSLNDTTPTVLYCFAEVPGFSRIGTYTGNGLADGPFAYCGFRPRFVMIKRTDNAGDWCMIDSARGEINPVSSLISAEQAAAELTNNIILDFLSNGFKIRSSASSSWNTNTATYIFIAFAEAPLKYSNAR